MDRIKQFINKLPTIFKLKRQIKKLEHENEAKSETIDNLKEHIKDISDSEIMDIKIKRLEQSRDHWLETVHKLRETNKELRKEIEDLKNEKQ